jgi:hypothetical protein
MRTLGLFASVLILGVAVQASDIGTLEGTVSLPEGAPLPNALVQIVHWGLKDAQTRTIDVLDQRDVRTDGKGHYSVELAPGAYDVFISDMALSPVAKKIEIKAGGRTTFSPRMKYDRLTKVTE